MVSPTKRIVSGAAESARSLKSWTPRTVGVDLAMQKMVKNLQKAIDEHKQKKESGGYIESYEKLKALSPSVKELPLNLAHELATYQKKESRPIDAGRQMEDRHIYKALENGVVAGVFDGHGGHEVSEFVSRQVQEQFSHYLQAANGNVHEAFEALFYELNRQVCEKREWNRQGTTACVSYIDLKTHLVYTATVADSEASIYRKMPDGTQSIPLTVVRDWACRTEAERAAHALKDIAIVEVWQRVKNPKLLRFPHSFYGLNVSRSMGDVAFKLQNMPHAISCKPKITICQLEPGDILHLSTDGFRDYVTEQEAIALLTTSEESHAQKLVNYAVNNKRSQDDVTVLLVKTS